MNAYAASAGYDAIVWGTPVDCLRLGLAADAGTAALHLQNVGDVPLSVLSYVHAGEQHFDWYTLSIQHGDAPIRHIRLLDDRNRSAPIIVQLAPSEGLYHHIDVAAWAKRAVNNAQPVPPCTYHLTAVYAVEADIAEHWHGTITAGPVDITIVQ